MPERDDDVCFRGQSGLNMLAASLSGFGPGADVRFRAALRYIEALEKELGRPVLTANQVVSWHLRLSVARTPVSGCGRIFDCDRIELVGMRMEP